MENYVSKTSTNITEMHRELPDDVMLKLQVYDSMAIDEKLELLRETVKLETDYLGTPSDSYVMTMKDLPEETYGWYDDSAKVIVLDSGLVRKSSLETTLNTCFHEVFHLYQHEVVRFIDENKVNNTDLLLMRQIVK